MRYHIICIASGLVVFRTNTQAEAERHLSRLNKDEYKIVHNIPA